jgi:hypothetical protein
MDSSPNEIAYEILKHVPGGQPLARAAAVSWRFYRLCRLVQTQRIRKWAREQKHARLSGAALEEFLDSVPPGSVSTGVFVYEEITWWAGLLYKGLPHGPWDGEALWNGTQFHWRAYYEGGVVMGPVRGWKERDGVQLNWMVFRPSNSSCLPYRLGMHEGMRVYIPFDMSGCCVRETSSAGATQVHAFEKVGDLTEHLRTTSTIGDIVDMQICGQPLASCPHEMTKQTHARAMALFQADD